MTFSDIFFALFYGAAFFLVIYFIFMLFQRRPVYTQQVSSDPTVIVIDEVPGYDLPYWPWTYTPYNYWPYWFPWGYGGGDGYYGRRWGPHNRVGWGRSHTRPWGGSGRGAHTGGFGMGGHHGGGGRR
jgi:hypothetical protein